MIKKRIGKVMLCGLLLGVGSSNTSINGLSFCPPLIAEEYTADFETWTEVFEGDIYIVVDAQYPDDVTVQIDGSTSGVEQDKDGTFWYKVKESDEYRIKVAIPGGEPMYELIEVQLDEAPPTLEVSRIYMDEDWYLKIIAEDDYKVESIYVNGESLAFDEDEPKTYYKVTESGEYVVKVEDGNGKKTTEEIYVDVKVDEEQSEAKVTLSKEYKDDAWYLVIEAEDHYGIKEVKVNGEKISFDSKSDKQYYKANKTDSYLVQVTNEDERTTEKYLYININDKVSIPPKLSLKQTDKEDGTYLTIEIEDNGEITSVKVEDKEVPYNKTTQIVEYPISKSGIYHVSVKDDEENEVKDFISISELAEVKSKGHTVIFNADSKMWQKDGISQNLLDVAPTMIDNRVYLPIRYVAEALEIPSNQITWNAQQNQVVIRNEDTIVTMKLGEYHMSVNGNQIEIPAPVAMVENRIMLPLSAIPQAFEQKQAELVWDNENKQAVMYYKGN